MNILKALTKVGVEETYLNTKVAVYDKTKANIILSNEKNESQILEQDKDTHFSPLLFNIVLEVLATTI